jgi:hypothetical protein
MRGITVPDFSVTRVGEIDVTAWPTITSTDRFASAFSAYARMSSLNIGMSVGPASIRALSSSTFG